MTQEEKDLLLKDLSAKLPYKVKVQYTAYPDTVCTLDDICVSTGGCIVDIDGTEECYNPNFDKLKPYLRPMGSMTKEELTWVEDNLYIADSTAPYYKEAEIFAVYSSKYIDWLNKHHFDYRGLIEKGLAIEAPEDMYN